MKFWGQDHATACSRSFADEAVWYSKQNLLKRIPESDSGFSRMTSETGKENREKKVP